MFAKTPKFYRKVAQGRVFIEEFANCTSENPKARPFRR
jgi:hypothetical protein